MADHADFQIETFRHDLTCCGDPGDCGAKCGTAKTPKDTKHFIVIEKYPACISCDRWYEEDMIPAFCLSADCHTDLRDSNNVEWESEYQVVHPEDCPKVLLYEGTEDIDPVYDDNCNVGMEVHYAGMDSLDVYPFTRWQDIPAGKYEIEFWFETSQAGWWGGGETDAGLSFVDFERDLGYPLGTTHTTEEA